MGSHVETVGVSIDGYNKESNPFSILRVDVDNSITGIDFFIIENVCSENDCEINTCMIEALQREGLIVIQAENCFARSCEYNYMTFCPLKKRVIIEIHNKSMNK